MGPFHSTNIHSTKRLYIREQADVFSSNLESLVTVEFEPTAAGKTRLTLTHSRFPEDKSRDEHERGWNGCLAKLDDAVARHTAESI